MGLRRMGSLQRKTMRIKVKRRNGLRKTRERASRDRRMLAIIQKGPLPYQAWVMSWLSDKLDNKPTKIINEADVEQVIAATTVKDAA